MAPIFLDADHLGGLVNNLNFWAVFQTHILSGERRGRCGLSNHLSDLVLREVGEIQVQLASALPVTSQGPSLCLHTFRNVALSSPHLPLHIQTDAFPAGLA